MRHHDQARLIVAVPLAIAAWWVVGLPPFSMAATVAVLVTGVTAIAVGTWQRWRERHPLPGSAAGTLRWAVLALAAAAWQLTAYLQHPRSDHPTISSLTNAALGSHPARAAAFVAWIGAAWGMARR